MRCKNCGSIMSHILTDIRGTRYYQCFQSLTHIGHRPGQPTRMVTCGYTCNHNHVPTPKNTIVAFIRDGKKIIDHLTGGQAAND